MGAIDSFKSLFGGSDAAARRQTSSIDGALGKLEELQQRLARVKSVLTNPQLTQFVVVTIATSLAVAESKRLVQSLRGEGIKVSSILCNQLLSDSIGAKYIATRRAAQHKCVDTVRNFLKTKLDTEPGYTPIEITEVPYVDTEVTGIYGLKYFAAVAHAPKANTATNPINSRKLTIFGGKGGVGAYCIVIMCVVLSCVCVGCWLRYFLNANCMTRFICLFSIES
jgi:anion-transporting  ArsA/GET3 family ATPase